MQEGNKAIVESVRDFILTCPFLSDGRVNIDYAGVQPTEYTLNGTPINKTIKRYIDGTSIRQFSFLFGSVERYGPDLRNNIENSGFYEEFDNWLDQQTRLGNLPDLGDRRQAQKIEAQSTGYLFDNGDDTGRYQIQCRLVYLQKGEF